MRFLNAYNNTGCYDFDNNGEGFALRIFAQHAPLRPVIWDVGAHKGEYALEAHATVPDAQVVSFEIIPQLARQLGEHVDPRWCEIREMGLSDSAGVVEVVWNKRADTTNSIKPLANEFFAHDDLEKVECPISTIDLLVQAGARAPHFLKIDVEGHEPAVLRGARNLLHGPDAPLVIQFEYGMTWIPASGLLHDVQMMLEQAGYGVGRLFPDHVAFKTYDWNDEHFRMGNMIAVKDPDLRRALA
ncbi:FkbM family methyltransferase [Croceicoccus sp. F390]|uniref:FkbM family methyltransferase n=1 Tax=Croceicoccus esteveae TaxID=3075597 RepID=A0ABU2ZI34_9SPHN|nr:FkbM family methyltransferase [Croceicoccus sp. F390]MDT0576031.1 FkbM family methyltransferase [Croceicoccus sp. F390]